jgi:hypothetical protein
MWLHLYYREKIDLVNLNLYHYFSDLLYVGRRRCNWISCHVQQQQVTSFFHVKNLHVSQPYDEPRERSLSTKSLTYVIRIRLEGSTVLDPIRIHNTWRQTLEEDFDPRWVDLSGPYPYWNKIINRGPHWNQCEALIPCWILVRMCLAFPVLTEMCALLLRMAAHWQHLGVKTQKWLYEMICVRTVSSPHRKTFFIVFTWKIFA